MVYRVEIQSISQRDIAHSLDLALCFVKSPEFVPLGGLSRFRVGYRPDNSFECGIIHDDFGSLPGGKVCSGFVVEDMEC